MILTDRQIDLLNRRKSPDLTISEFVEVSILQTEIQFNEREFDSQISDEIQDLYQRIEKLGGDPKMSEVNAIIGRGRQLHVEIMKRPKRV